MSLNKLLQLVLEKKRFSSLKDYISFTEEYLEYIEKGLQATIVSQNENNYRFFQYGKEANFQVTRPINGNLMYGKDEFISNSEKLLTLLKVANDPKNQTQDNINLIDRSIYTIQQSIGATLDALPAHKSNTAKKINGDLFERLVRLTIEETGVENVAKTVKVPVMVDGEKVMDMSFQQDLVVANKKGEVEVIGSIKTSSKDRLGKIFYDKLLFNKLSEIDIPHIAIFLNDVQRKNGKIDGKYGVNGTFLSGHFRAYTIKINPLDGVYYCDLRPLMKTDPFFQSHIKSFGLLILNDLWVFKK